MSPSYIAKISLKGEFLEVSKEWANLLGYTQDELKTLTFLDITPAEDLKIDLELMKIVLGGERKTYKLKKRYKHKQGFLTWVLLTVLLVRDNKKKTALFYKSNSTY